METISQIIKGGVKHANFIYTVISTTKAEYSPDGFLIGTFKLKNNKHYDVFVTSNFRPTSINSIVNLTSNRFELMEEDLLEEIFTNNMDQYLKFDSEAYYHIVCKENPDEIKFIFTDYDEVVEYLELIEKKSSN